MTPEQWKLITEWELDDTIHRVNEYVSAGPANKKMLFAVRYFLRPTKLRDWREIGYYIPMMQPEGALVTFRNSNEGRVWSSGALRRIGLASLSQYQRSRL